MADSGDEFYNVGITAAY